MSEYHINSDGRMKKFSSNSSKTQVFYHSKKIYDTRWKMKKYLTIEEIRNSDKLKQMDHKNNLIDDIEQKTTFNTRKWIMFGVDILAIILLVGLLKKHKKL